MECRDCGIKGEAFKFAVFDNEQKTAFHLECPKCGCAWLYCNKSLKQKIIDWLKKIRGKKD